MLNLSEDVMAKLNASIKAKFGVTYDEFCDLEPDEQQLLIQKYHEKQKQNEKPKEKGPQKTHIYRR